MINGGSRDDFIIAIRSAFLKKGNQQRFSLIGLIFFSIIILVLGSFNFKVINYLKVGIKEIVYRSSFIVSVPENFVKSIYYLTDDHFKIYNEFNSNLLELENLKSKDLLNEAIVLDYQRLKNVINDYLIASEEIVAKILIDKKSPFLRSVIANKGSKDGIKLGMVVTENEYLVGKVVEVNYLTARILLLSDLNSKIPVRIEPNGIQSILSGTGEETGIIQYQKERYTIENGSTIYTSGSGDLFQSGIPVGTINDLDSPGIKGVTFFSDFSQLRFVKILSYKKTRFNVSKEVGIINTDISNQMADLSKGQMKALSNPITKFNIMDSDTNPQSRDYNTILNDVGFRAQDIKGKPPTKQNIIDYYNGTYKPQARLTNEEYLSRNNNLTANANNIARDFTYDTTSPLEDNDMQYTVGNEFNVTPQQTMFDKAKNFASSGLAKTGKLGIDVVNMLKNNNPLGFVSSLANTRNPLNPGSSNYDSNLQGIVDKYTSFYAATDEKHDPKAYDKDLNNLIKAKGIEVGHIFHFGQKYSKPMQANINTYEGKNIPVFMGSYGVGLSRLVGAVIEASHDKDGIIWPKEIAPWYYHLINLKNGDKECDKICFDIYNSIEKQSKTVLYDDTSDRAGAKLAKADLIGLPFQIIIGPRGIKDKIFDLKIRKNGEIKKLSYNELLNFINNN